MAAPLYTPLPFGTYYYQTLQKPGYFKNLSQEYKDNPGYSNNPKSGTSKGKKNSPYLMCLPVCPCCCCMCMRLYYYNVMIKDPNGEEIIASPEETGPISTGIPSIPGMPYSIGGILGHHGLPFEAQHITREE